MTDQWSYDSKALYTPVDHVAQRVERPYIDGR